MEYTKPFFLPLLLVVLGVCLTTSQRTFSRSCDCEYMTEDGKCAYTILLPTGGSSKDSSSQCPKKDMEADREQAEQLMGHLGQLRANISELRMVSGDQARMLSQLQSLLLSQQEALRPLTEMLTDKGESMSGEDSDAEESGSGSGSSSSNSMGMGGSDSSSSMGMGGGRGNCQLCPQVEQTLAEQRQSIQSLQEQIIQVYTSLTGLSDSLGNLDQLLPMDQITRAIEQQQNQTRALERHIQELLANASKAEQEAQMMMKMNPYFCQRRGLLVSGPIMNITDDMITASSMYNDGHAAVRGRINAQATGDTLKGAWCAAEPNAPEEWLQFNLGKITTIYGVVTKGRSDYLQLVSTYSLNYTTTDPTAEGAIWTPYTNVLGEVETLMGNTDQNTAQVNMLWQPIRARYVRIIPLSSDTNKCMRADLIGCLDEQ